MSLPSDRKIAHYEILGAVGKGGMGEVYRARDTKLDRDVAIKVLPEAFANEAERLARFEREAQLLASLNHPNIASIYGFESGALVLELVEGPTLAERIAQGPISVDEAIAIAKQIAEALEAGHEAGVIHRDLKPANIKLKEDGTVKVLDYGLAKALEGDAPAGTDSELSQSPTRLRQPVRRSLDGGGGFGAPSAPAQGTQVGVILGTAAYMSPEQAKGKRVDKRTDIWAFGAVRYEMLTGAKAFPGEDVSEILAAVIKQEPDWSALPAGLSPRLRELLARCLKKDPKKRRRDIGDVGNELAEPTPVPGAAPKRTAWNLATVVAVSFVAAVFAGLMGWSMRAPEPQARFVTRVSLSIPPEHGLRARYDCGSAVALSPDGRTLVYVGTEGGTAVLFARPLDRNDATKLAGTEGACQPFFSPDGSRLGFFADDALRSVALEGGPVFTLAELVMSVGGGAWGHDGTIWFSPGQGPLLRVSENGGDAVVATKLDADAREQRHTHPMSLADGSIVFMVSAAKGDFVAVADSRNPGRHRRLTADRGTIRDLYYSSSGHLIFHEETTLFAMPFDATASKSPSGPVRVLEGVPYSGQFHAHYGLALNGTLAYVATEVQKPMVPVWVDRTGNAVAIPGAPPQHYVDPRLSPQGDQLAVTVIEPENLDVWVLDLSREVLTRITLDPAAELRGLWTPDGERLVFASNRLGSYGIYTVPSDGSGAPEALVFADGTNWFPTAISADGRIVMRAGYGTDTDIGVVSLSQPGEPELLLASQQSEHSGVLSPDDRWLAYVSGESGHDEIYLRSFPDMSAKLKISSDGGTEPMWSPRGDELFYRSAHQMMSVPFTGADEPRPGKPVVLFEDAFERSTARSPWPYYDVVDGGDRFVMLRSLDPADAPGEVQLILGWAEELKRAVPR